MTRATLSQQLQLSYYERSHVDGHNYRDVSVNRNHLLIGKLPRYTCQINRARVSCFSSSLFIMTPGACRLVQRVHETINGSSVQGSLHMMQSICSGTRPAAWPCVRGLSTSVFLSSVDLKVCSHQMRVWRARYRRNTTRPV